MTNLTSQQRSFLTKKAQVLKPVVMIGGNGLQGPVIKATHKALDDHELIKVKFVDFKDEKKEIAAKLAEKTGSILIRIIGNIAVLYRKSENKKYVLPE